jgi:SpoU rRNA methylase family enzyme
MQARLKLQNTALTKSGHNKFAGYKYFELGDFLPTIQNIFNELGLCGVVSYTQDLATLTITDGTDNIVITSPMGSAALKGCHEVQNIGAVETYQRRYLWVTAMEIVEHDVLDAVTGTDTGNAVKKPESVTPLAGALDGFTAQEVELLHGLAEEITFFVKNDDVAQAKEVAGSLSNEEKTALWSLLDSKTRSAMKKG